MKLKPCPFCGGEAKYQKITDAMGDVVFVGYIVKCTKCFAAPLPNNYTGDKKKAAERWNRRESADEIVKGVKDGSEQ